MKQFIAYLFLALAAFVLTPTPASGKRPAPNPVPAVLASSVEYSAPHDQMGFVVATDTKTRKELWRVRIYTVRIDPALERDVQDVFITSLALENGTLVITNESRDSYTLDLATRKVTKQKAVPLLHSAGSSLSGSGPPFRRVPFGVWRT